MGGSEDELKNVGVGVKVEAGLGNIVLIFCKKVEIVKCEEQLSLDLVHLVNLVHLGYPVFPVYIINLFKPIKVNPTLTKIELGPAQPKLSPSLLPVIPRHFSRLQHVCNLKIDLSICTSSQLPPPPFLVGRFINYFHFKHAEEEKKVITVPTEGAKGRRH